MSTPELTAEPSWQAVDFISDLHLQVGELHTFNAWQRYMQTTPADAIFILGDLFEAWVGDDVMAETSFEYQCAQVLKQTSARVPTFFMRGNRDFLVGRSMMNACNTNLLEDPSVFIFNQQRWLLSHGDALCLDDEPYMHFRELVRSVDWQKAFLAKPLAERQAIARDLRQQSEARKESGAQYADVDAAAARQWLEQTNANTLIHGHTHKPGRHDLGGGLQRVVMSDWDAEAKPPRAEALRLSVVGLERIVVL